MSKDANKGKPIPIRFEPPLEFLIETLARRTGFSRSEIIRRCVRLAKGVIAERGPDVLYELTAEKLSLPKRQKKKHE